MRKSIICLTALIFCALTSFAQQVIQGKVLDRSGQPLEGATVKQKGTNNGTSTDKDGNFSLKLTTGNAILLFSGVGLTDQELSTNGKSYFNVTMANSALSLGAVEVVGSRSLKRSATETPVPVDIIPIAKITNTVGQVDLNQILQYLAPSFNSNRQSGADGADHVDPASLRGLGPDQTLVLVNGKRWHQSSLVNLFGTRGRGNTGTDLNTIPAAAIERIEILRDGAAAQYGSDAIAGVINIILKNNVNQGSANVNFGGNITGYGVQAAPNGLKPFSTKSDGLTLNANINYGFALKNGGFLNLTGDYLHKDKTSRPNYPVAVSGDPRRQSGDAALDNYSLFFNGGFKLKGSASFYLFGGISQRNSKAYAYTREADDDRNIPSIYPNGFDPINKADIADQSVSFGIKSKIGAWNADFNATLGNNRFEYNLSNTLNASLGATSPTSFFCGGFQLSQYLTSANFTRSFPKVAKGANIAFGTEYRIDQYKIFKGEIASYKQYTQFNDAPGGAQGFPGFQPADETNQNRTNWGTYIDAELDATDYYLISAAVRAENYSDFGWTANFKLANRIKFDETFSLRGSFSTGFRAPSLPQINFSNTFTNVAAGVISEVVIAPNSGTLAKTAGIPSLKQETSTNLSIGFTTKPIKNLSITVDAYQVNIKDRIVLTGYVDQSNPAIGAILAASNIASAQFFTNSVDTKTKGLDVVISYGFKAGKGRINSTFAGNFNDLEISKVNVNTKLAIPADVYLSNRERYFLMASAPSSKLSLTTDYKVNKFTTTLRITHFAGIDLINYADELEVNKAKAITDLSFNYAFNKQFSLTVGGTNIFDVYPTTQGDPGLTETGTRWEAIQMGMGGAFYFAKFGIRF